MGATIEIRESAKWVSLGNALNEKLHGGQN